MLTLIKPSTGHAHHFLSRLDRLSRPHLDLALALYRDPELVRFVLAHVRLPRAAERAAISLGDRAAGPFVIVTREGRFVTCLGSGMAPHRFVVTRIQLEGAFAAIAILRGQRLAAVRPAWPPGPDPNGRCDCGSSRRRKRCCGAERALPRAA